METTSHIATDEAQSQRLIQCGVSEDTADMGWREPYNPYPERLEGTKELRAMSYRSLEVIYGKDYVTPAWSLSRLLALLPPTIKKGNTDYFLDFAPFEDKGWGFGYYNEKGIRTIKGLTQPGNPIEASVCLIEWLKWNGYSLNEINAENQ